MSSVQAVLVEVLQARRSGPSTPPLRKYGQHMSRANSSATVVPKDIKRCRLVAALLHSHDRSRRGTEEYKNDSDDVPGTPRPTSLLYKTPVSWQPGIQVR